jgi:uncharacterized protein YcbX
VPVVVGLAVTPVKGTRLRPVERIVLDRDGVRENRRFYVIDDRGRMVNAKIVGELTTVVADYEDSARALSLTLPDGRIVAGTVRLGEPVQTLFFSEPVAARLVEGEWSGALSDAVGQPLRLVEPVDRAAGAVDRGGDGAASLISRASLGRLAAEAGVDGVDVRRFRMLIEIDGVAANEEDRWVGSRVRVGEALIKFRGHVGRCLITSRDPDSGNIDLPTLDLLGRYRNGLGTTEPLPFGIYGEVLEPGLVRVGDPVSL